MKQYRNLETDSSIYDSKYYKSVGKGLMKYWPLIQKNIRPYSCTLAWKIPWTEEPGGLQSMGSQKSRTWLSDFTFTCHFHALEKEMATHSSVLAWRIPGTVEPGGLPSMGSHRVRYDWSDLAAAAAVQMQSVYYLFSLLRTHLSRSLSIISLWIDLSQVIQFSSVS